MVESCRSSNRRAANRLPHTRTLVQRDSILLDAVESRLVTEQDGAGVTAGALNSEYEYRRFPRPWDYCRRVYRPDPFRAGMVKSCRSSNRRAANRLPHTRTLVQRDSIFLDAVESRPVTEQDGAGVIAGELNSE